MNYQTLKKHFIDIKKVSLLRNNFNTSTDTDKCLKSIVYI